MNISIIGCGNVATVTGRLLQKECTILEIVSRNKPGARQLAHELNAVAVENIALMNPDSDACIIAVKDDAIETVANQLHVNNSVVMHTAGSVSINVLKNTSENYGVLYPLQSLRKEINYEPVIPFLIDGNNAYSKEIITKIASSISQNVTAASDEQRLKYHLSAVVVSNFSNYLFTLTKQYCDDNQLNFLALLPLIQETVTRLKNYDPSKIQTGPAVRGDLSTIQKHLELLNDFPELKKIYALMSESIISNRISYY